MQAPVQSDHEDEEKDNEKQVETVELMDDEPQHSPPASPPPQFITKKSKAQKLR